MPSKGKSRFTVRLGDDRLDKIISLIRPDASVGEFIRSAIDAKLNPPSGAS